MSSGTQAILSRTKANLAEAEITLRLCGLPYRYLNGSSALHTRTEIGILVVGVLLSVYGDLRLLENHPNKQAIVYGFLKEAGFSWQKGQFKAALSGLMAPHADLWSALGQLFEGAQNQKIGWAGSPLSARKTERKRLLSMCYYACVWRVSLIVLALRV